MPLTDGAIMLQEEEKRRGGISWDDIRVFRCFPRVVLIILWQKGPIKLSLTVPEYIQQGTYLIMTGLAASRKPSTLKLIVTDIK